MSDSDPTQHKEETQGLLKAEDGEASSNSLPPAVMHENAVAKAAATEDPKITMLRTWWGTCYATAMSVCGIVLVALGSTLTSLAANCGFARGELQHCALRLRISARASCCLQPDLRWASAHL